MANLEFKTSAQNLAESAVHARIRDKLNVEGVKLWLEPFYDEAQKTVKDSEILALASRYSTELELPEAEVSEVMYSLQKNAIERLAERVVFQTTGLATVRLRFSGFKVDRIVQDSTLSRMQVNLSQTTGKQLKWNIAQMITVPEKGLKLICAGKVINEDQVLDQQNIKNGGQIMVLSVAIDHENLQEVEDQFRELEEAKNSADYLANQDGTDGLYSLQVADQSGKPLNLPDAEKKSLTIALTLHEKGRAAMKSQHFSKSLVFLLEADTLYGQCQSSILDMVDNFGLLNLDIAWCYLSLQSIAELPQVENRLKKCERALKRSYGEDMERVIALKGSSGWEAALYVRLHLLQGIASYHLGQIEKSKFYISKAEGELARLKVSDDNLVCLISMGYSQDEARVALRSTYGDMTNAVDFIIRKREEKAEIKKQEEEDLKRRKLQKKLGKCLNGDLVNIQTFRQLKSMGYSPSLIAEALRKTNNDMNSTIQLMSDDAFQGEVLSQIIDKVSSQPSTSSSPSSAVSAAIANVSELVASLPEATSQALAENLSHAVNNPAIAAAINQIKTVLDQTYSEESLANTSPTVSEEAIERSRKAYENISKDMCSEADYIDLTLGPENTYLDQYKALLQSL